MSKLRFNYKSLGDVQKLIDKVKKSIRQIQEEGFYNAVESSSDDISVDLVQTLKRIRKEHLGVIDVVCEDVTKGIVRKVYKFTIAGEGVVSMHVHGDESGFIYISASDRFSEVSNIIKSM